MLPEHAPLTPDQRKSLDAILSALDPIQKSWLSGYLAASGSQAAAKPSAGPVKAGKLIVLYGTESGNSEELAARAVKEAKKRGFQAVMKNMSEISPADLVKTSQLLVVVSTWGDGDPPESAAGFYQEFMQGEYSLSSVRFSVCALGDTSYEKFCQIGKDVDARLEKCGAARVAPRQDCDVDYEADFSTWLDASLKALAPTEVSIAAPADFSEPVPASTVEYGKKNPFPAEVLDNLLLNGEGTSKETIHIEFSLEGSGLHYEPGDALGVIPINAPDVVQAVLDAAKLTGEEEVDVKNVGKKRLADALREDYDITGLSRAVLTKLAAASESATLTALLADDAKEQLKEYNYGREIVDAITDFAPNGLSAESLTGIFRKLPARLYSIASSPLAHPDEVHLTVAAVRYDTHGRSRKGVCSTYLADLAKTGESVSLFVQPNKNFRLPADTTTPVIMVGPGTGVAPFRSFVEHRAAMGAEGKTWLFFGDQHYLYDFLYQLEWQDYLKSGALSRLDLAFSRDQPEKIYVQDRMIEQAAEIYQWLEQGAHFYVCGDAQRMAHDVHEALISVVEFQGGVSREEAEAYVENLKKTKRYQRDVY
ncbi:assimilatory sulfite reductase (NADPH) flavoprotein subunit [Luteolibacter pohnpeiensis]|uniref:assimilatory sulfite reductase (NADPH) n=1 Tax=Luteolibacter pohnpeiensis TaxID=454153 RepID=A0A934VUX1_9BACT|nr:assimilatory sulfite reductase (NADPH) flavoprotein subunit [Luteolibacter pohnpeiensis]MBK1882982.1 assimilatory sulfite reductase (NADPH) flavoprotein subunit [Luteolibacter pohnpeiensis]